MRSVNDRTVDSPVDDVDSGGINPVVVVNDLANMLSVESVMRTVIMQADEKGVVLSNEQIAILSKVAENMIFVETHLSFLNDAEADVTADLIEGLTSDVIKTLERFYTVFQTTHIQ